MNALRLALQMGVAGLLLLALPGSAAGAPGDLDVTFGSGGQVIVTPGIESVAYAAIAQSDGKLVLAGMVNDVAPPPPPPSLPRAPKQSNPDFLAIRLTANGSLDGLFGSGGAVRVPIDVASSFDFARAVAVGPGDVVVLAGETITPSGHFDAAIVRLTSSGALDSTFSGDGILTLGQGAVGRFDGVSGVAVQPDGKIVAVGRGAGGFMVIRLLADGTLDPGFGVGGVVDTPISDLFTRDEASAVVLAGDGKIIVAGTADTEYPYDTDVALVRYLSNGQTDPTFGSGGIVVTRGSHAERGYALAAAPGGKILVAGDDGPGGFLVARYLATGELDRSFGTAGLVSTSFGGVYAAARSIAVDVDGRVVAAGTTLTGTNDMFALARYNPDGTLDASFGTGGKRSYDVLAGRDYGAAVLIRRDEGRLVLAGQASDGTADHVAAIGVEVGPLAPPSPPVRCRVPRVVHLRLAKARSKLRRAHCSVGRIRRVRAPRFQGIVVGQFPPAGRRLRRGARVNLVLGRK